eukprot:TRINITY_DN5597_c0_g1_i1.p2 TRINITY_DN5597_c0_g1~~TRINITY_DN5597_c0_g1_i1.p2  ORF type:complete len:56 (+),score=10.92 TRINITY_DN5597_c0_g1_i1:244-411(+)
MASEPKKYQKLKFLGAGYCAICMFQTRVIGIRSSIQSTIYNIACRSSETAKAHRG